MTESLSSAPGESFTGVTFSRDDWYAEEIVGRSYTDCQFHQIELTEAVLQNCTFTNCIFGNVSFNASRHVDSAFLGCTFRRCNFFDVEFSGCKLLGSTFEQSASLRPMRVIGGDWSFVVLAGADLRGCSFQSVRMREADLTAANCVDTVFADVDLSGAMLHGARFTRADLRGSDLSSLDPQGTDVRDAQILPEQAVAIAEALGLRVLAR
ncbi:uncharacterized protein YjbI with pentapeptide repeats [Jatrophihabitans sp. GAS493]|uniref:pentapeptide repeat-containing protein n=1 Tax=Jatrophihabitans sp. GAS493 TaxID=1907575 RepID=UPI000BBFD5A5|nr:pentapeptide repeat-containing protein [Jatrophihabitans sp. GAS493]SOD71482.1 uncharacterized protein YjbI with pentapeptide repeats [Jatrophihabitans sp. GAS493]